MLLMHFTCSENKELYPIVTGYYECPSSNSYGPHVRDYTIVHCVLRGKGVLYNSRGAHKVSPGEMFIIRKGEVTTYVADKDEPWEYVWLGFYGERAALFDKIADVLETPGDIDTKIYKYVQQGEQNSDIYTSILYEFVYHLFSNSEDEHSDQRVRHVHRFIKYNYMDGVTIAGLADAFGFERSYLYRIFKERYGIGPKEYLTRVRLEKAKWLLAQGYSVAECAYMVGYSDAFSLSKAYKKHYGIAPSHDDFS